ncbi:MAG: TonB-dependent receptor [Bacteroidota bacterium]
MKRIFKTNVFAFALLTMLSFVAKAQEVEDVDLSLEDLMNMTIESASKKQESLFDAPVSSYSITSTEIERAGATSIPEALRLAPGLIVRETTNGNYDIHLRGFDNLGRFTLNADQTNLITLVMIDNRPIFNYNQGGVFWESLPIDIIDVERIEIVRGPSAPLFGPNAVAGVINIITKNQQSEELRVVGNVQYGTPNTFIGNTSISKKISDKIGVTISGNYQRRERHENTYYEFDRDTVLASPDLLQRSRFFSGQPISNVDTKFSNPELALEKYGVNAFINYDIREGAHLRVSTGLQDAKAQRVFLNGDITPLSFNENDSRYFNIEGSFDGLNFRAAYNRGFDDVQLGSDEFNSQYDFNTYDIVVNYDWQVADNLSIRPEVNYQRAAYDDSDFLAESTQAGFFNGEAEISTIAASLRADYYLLKNLRLVAGVRADKFETPDDTYISYQFAGTYKLNDKYLFRAVHARSNSGSFLGPTFVNAPVLRDLPTGTVLTTNVLGNQNLDLTTITSSEIGFRAQITQSVQLDVEFFTQKLENLANVIQTGITFLPSPPFPAGVPETTTFEYNNLPLEARQNGVTLALNIVPNSQLQLKPFVTWQQTDVEDLPLGLNKLPISDTNPTNFNTRIDGENESTPSFFGGAYINYAFANKFNINLNPYFFSGHEQFHAVDNDLAHIGRDSEFRNIDAKFILNAKVSYDVAPFLNVYFNARNLTNDDSREYYGTSQIGGLYLLGAQFNF